MGFLLQLGRQASQCQPMTKSGEGARMSAERLMAADGFQRLANQLAK